MSTFVLPDKLCSKFDAKEHVLWSQRSESGSTPPSPVILMLLVLGAMVALVVSGAAPTDAPEFLLLLLLVGLVGALIARSTLTLRKATVYVLTNTRAIVYVDKAAPNFAWLPLTGDTQVRLGALGRVEFSHPGEAHFSRGPSVKYLLSGPSTKHPDVFPSHGRQKRLVFSNVDISAADLGLFRQAIAKAPQETVA